MVLETFLSGQGPINIVFGPCITQFFFFLKLVLTLLLWPNFLGFRIFYDKGYRVSFVTKNGIDMVFPTTVGSIDNFNEVVIHSIGDIR